MYKSNEHSLDINSREISLEKGKRKLSLKERPDNQNITGDSITHILEKRQSSPMAIRKGAYEETASLKQGEISKNSIDGSK